MEYILCAWSFMIFAQNQFVAIDFVTKVYKFLAQC